MPSYTVLIVSGRYEKVADEIKFNKMLLTDFASIAKVGESIGTLTGVRTCGNMIDAFRPILTWGQAAFARATQLSSTSAKRTRKILILAQ